MALARKKKADSGDEQPVAPKPSKPRKRKKPPKKSGGRAKRFVVLLGDEGAILVFMEGDKVVRRLFAPSVQPANTEAMIALIQSHPNVPVSMLVDNLDQQYVRQSFPPVSSLSVSGLVKRRLDRDFQPEDLKGSMPLGRDKSGRKEWNFLLIALVKTATLTAWIDLVSELPNPFTGIYLMPVETTVYMQMLMATLDIAMPKPWQLLVTHNKVSGFRQVVVNQGKLVFTRVSQAIDDAIPAVIAGNIEQEIINTIEYLRRLGFQDTSGLDIVVVASQDVNDALDLKRFNLGSTRAVTPLDVADLLGLEQAALSADRFGDVVLAAAFLRAKKHVLRFSTAYAESLKKIYMARKALKLMTGLAAVALLGLSVENIFDSMANKSQMEESESKRKALQGQLTELKKNAAGLNDNLAFKSLVVSLYDTYLKDNHPPMEFMQALAKNLTPEQRISSMEWSGSAAKKTAPAAGGAAPAGGSEKTDKAAADGPISVKVVFEFRGVYADVDNLSKAEQSFLDTLAQKMPEYTITHELFPWLKNAEKGMEISFDQKQTASIKEGDNILAVTFNGPKKKADEGKAKPEAGNQPGGAPKPFPGRPAP